MAEKKLSIKLSAKDRLSKALRTAGGAARKAGGALTSMATAGSRAIEGLTRKLFFLKEAINVVAQVARGLWDAFITPAVNARKLAASLTNVFGGGTAQKIRKFSKETGLGFETISRAALDMEQKLGKAGGLDSYLKAIERVSKWRPDLGAEGAVSFVNDLVNKVAEATEGSGKQLGQYTSVVIGGTAGQMVDLSKELDKLGVVAKVVDPAVTALDRLRAAWDEFAANVGGKVLDKLAEGALKLLDWLTKNEDKVLRLTGAFTDLINQGIQKLIDWIDKGGLDDLITKFGEWWKIIEDIAAALAPVGKFIGQIGKGFGGGGAPASFGQAVGQTVSRPRQAYESAVGTVGQGVGAAFGAVGGLFGKRQGRRAALFGQGVGEHIARGGPMNIPQAVAAGAQKVRVEVSVDDSGALQAYTQKEIGRNNSDMVGAWSK